MAPAPGEHARPCPVSTGRGTRRVHLVRGGGGGRAPCARRAPPPSRPFSWTAISSPAAAAPPPPPATPAPHFREHPLRGAPAEAQERPLDGSAASGGHQSVLLRLLLRAPDLGRPRRKRLDLLHLSQTPPPRRQRFSAQRRRRCARIYTEWRRHRRRGGLRCVAHRHSTRLHLGENRPAARVQAQRLVRRRGRAEGGRDLDEVAHLLWEVHLVQVGDCPRRHRPAHIRGGLWLPLAVAVLFLLPVVLVAACPISTG